jgi:hypothetical protein
MKSNLKHSRVISLTVLVLLAGLAHSGWSNGPLRAIGSSETTFDSEVWGLYLRGVPNTLLRDGADQIRLAFGWPRTVPGDVPLWGRSPAVFDLDHNGDLEIAVVIGDGRLAILQHDGANYPGFPTQSHLGGRPQAWIDPTHSAQVAIGDVNHDGSPEAIYLTDIGFLHAVGGNHLEPQPFPVDVGRDVALSTPAVADLNGDLQSETVFTSYTIRPVMDDSLARLHVINGSGQELNGWPVAYGYGSNSSPAIGDINNDGVAEIIICSARRMAEPGRLWVFNLDGTRRQGFPAGNFETIGGAPILADINGDGVLEILFYARDFNGERQGIFAYDSVGHIINGFPLITDGGHSYGSPSIGGSAADGSLQIAFGTYDPAHGARIELFNFNAEQPDGYPVVTGSPAVVGSVIMADVTGDGIAEVIAAMAPSGGGAGWIGAWREGGQMADGFPIDLADFGGGAFASSPTAWDVNLDGLTELVCATTDGRIFVWQTPGFFSGDIWPTEKGGFGRLGMKPPRFIQGVHDEGRAELPSDVSVVSYPNPFNSSVQIEFQLRAPGRMTLALFDTQSRLIGDLFTGNLPAGASHIVFDVAELKLVSGVYLLRWQADHRSGVRQLLYLP